MPPASSDEEEIERTKKLIDKGNAEAFHQLAGYYAAGTNGMPQNYQKANELYLKAGELGCADGYHNLGILYSTGRGVGIDKKKAKHYFELAAMAGDLSARHNLAGVEAEAGNYQRSMKHSILAAKAGYEESMDQVKQCYIRGFVTKDEYANTLRAYQKSLDEMKSDERDKAASEMQD